MRWASRGKIRFLKNIAGLWLLQECRRRGCWRARSTATSNSRSMAAEARPFSAAIDPDAFLEPGEMPAQDCRVLPRTGQSAARDTWRISRARFWRAWRCAIATWWRIWRRCPGRKIEVIHIVGGGSRNALLNQFVADCTGRRVVAGPSEATAIGNILVQAMGAGELAESGRSARRWCATRSSLTTVDPHPSAEWEAAYQRYF